MELISKRSKHNLFIMPTFKIYLLVFLAFFAAAKGMAQQVNVSVTLRPPYSSNIADYYHFENKAVIIITNTGAAPVSLRLGGSITNVQRGVYIRTNPDARPLQPINVPAFGTTTITANPDVMNFFDQNNVTTNGNSRMLATIIQTGKLPEGNYELCLEAYDYNTNRLLSARGNGCFNFELSWLDPPVITFPQNGHIYPAEQAAKNFSWTPPLGNLAGALIEYDQVVVKVQPGQNPNDAIAAARDFKAGNPVLNKTGLMSQSYITQPFDLPFEEGAVYAMQIVARDRNGKQLIKNEGRSEIVTFSLGTSALNEKIVQNPLGNSSPKFIAKQLTGKLRYYWNKNGSASKYNNYGQSVGDGLSMNPNNQQLAGSGGGLGVQQSNDPLYGNKPDGSLFYGNQTGFSNKQNSPLAGVTVQLYVVTQYKIAEGIQPASLDNLETSFNSSGLHEGRDGIIYEGGPLATATTATDGSFSFGVPDLEDMNFEWEQDQTPASVNGTRSPDNPLGQVVSLNTWRRKVLMIKVATAPHTAWRYPMQFVGGDILSQGADMGTFYSPVVEYSETVTVAEKNNPGITKSGMEVLLLRVKTAQRPSYIYVPKDEVHPGNFTDPEIFRFNNVDYEIIAKDTTNAQGKATFDHIVGQRCTDNTNMLYYYARPADNLSTGYSLVFPAPQKLYTGCIYKGVIGVDLDIPRIYARVSNTVAGNMGEMAMYEQGAKWTLWRIKKAGAVQLGQSHGNWGALIENNKTNWAYIRSVLATSGNNAYPAKTGITGASGRIDVKEMYVTWSPTNEDYYFVLEIEKDGFSAIITPVNKNSSASAAQGDMLPVKKGEAYNLGDLDLKPNGKVTITLKDEEGRSLHGQAYYTDHPATAQVGEIQPLTPGFFINLAVPSGNGRKIVILPKDMEVYQQDTISIDVPASGVLEKEVVVKYKLHRIYFNIQGSSGIGNSNQKKALQNAKIELLDPVNIKMYPGLHSPYISEGTSSNVNNLPTGGGRTDNSSGMADDLVNEFTRTTNQGGGADFAFRNSGSRFKFRITGPKGEVSYVVIDKEVASTAGKYWLKVNVTLKAGRTVKGTVKLGTVPVAMARVKLENRLPLIETFTNEAGEYILTGVPADSNLIFSAAKSGYVGMEFDENNPTQLYYAGSAVHSNVMIAGTSNIGITTIDFKLRIYDGLDLSQMLGFPLEVTKLTETKNGVVSRGGSAAKTVTISGQVVISDADNEIFKMRGETTDGNPLSTIRFSDIIVIADEKKNAVDTPYARPKTLPMSTSVNFQEISVFGKEGYNAIMGDTEKGVTLNNFSSGDTMLGVAQGKVIIDISSFGSNRFAQKEEMFLKPIAGSNNLFFPVFTASGIPVIDPQSGFLISNGTGGSFEYLLKYGQDSFSVKASSTSSRLYKAAVKLDSRLQTNFKNVNPQHANLNLHLGDITIGSNGQLFDIARSVAAQNMEAQTLQLGEFAIHFSSLKMDESGVQFGGKLDALGMEIPFADATLHPSSFVLLQGSLNLNSLSILGGSVPVKADDGATFGYDGTEKNAWYLTIRDDDEDGTATSISGEHLEGLDKNAVVGFKSMWFYSNGSKSVSLSENNPAYRLHNIVDFTINQAELFPNTLSLNGIMDLGIRDFTGYQTALNYERPEAASAKPALTIVDFSMPNVLIKGVSLNFNPGNMTDDEGLYSSSIQFLDKVNGKLQIRGYLRDENPEVFKGVKYTLTKTNNSTELTLDETPKQTIKLGGSSSESKLLLSNIDGKMWVTDTGWTHLYFNGDMPEEMGFTSNGKRMRFDVEGKLKVTNQKVRLQKATKDLSGLSLEYDMINHRLKGQMSFSDNIGTATVNGMAEVVMDKRGYYFMSGGQMTMSNPKVEGAAFLLFGDYQLAGGDLESHVDGMLRQYSKYVENLNELPMGYLNMKEGRLRGFFFEGAGEIPFPALPNFEVDLVVVSAKLEVNIGGDILFGINFGEESTSYNLGMGAFINADLALGVNLGIVGGGVAMHGDAGIYIDGTYSANDYYQLAVMGYIHITGSAWATALGFDVTVEGSVGIDAKGYVTNRPGEADKFELVFRGEVKDGKVQAPDVTETKRVENPPKEGGQ